VPEGGAEFICQPRHGAPSGVPIADQIARRRSIRPVQPNLRHRFLRRDRWNRRYNSVRVRNSCGAGGSIGAPPSGMSAFSAISESALSSIDTCASRLVGLLGFVRVPRALPLHCRLGRLSRPVFVPHARVISSSRRRCRQGHRPIDRRNPCQK
jgi:hypothetical protein